MQLGRLVMSTEPNIAKPSGGGLKSSARRHCSHFRQACRWLLDQSVYQVKYLVSLSRACEAITACRATTARRHCTHLRGICLPGVASAGGTHFSIIAHTS